MSNIVFPIAEVPAFTETSARYDEKYKPSIAWDIEKGDFVRNGANRLTACSGREAYKTWCYKTILTERFACLAYPDTIGTELEQAKKEKSNAAVESAVERTITEALMVNPRTEYVRGFQFSWEREQLLCSFQVKGIQWEEFKVLAALNQEVI